MFGYYTDESLLREQRWEAQKTWPFLTEPDLRSVHSERDLVNLVQCGKGISLQAAASKVADWMLGYHQRLTRPDRERSSATPSPPFRPVW